MSDLRVVVSIKGLMPQSHMAKIRVMKAPSQPLLDWKAPELFSPLRANDVGIMQSQILATKIKEAICQRVGLKSAPQGPQAKEPGSSTHVRSGGF